jgi:hypothetical protein
VEVVSVHEEQKENVSNQEPNAQMIRDFMPWTPHRFNWSGENEDADGEADYGQRAQDPRQNFKG